MGPLGFALNYWYVSLGSSHLLFLDLLVLISLLNQSLTTTKVDPITLSCCNELNSIAEIWCINAFKLELQAAFLLVETMPVVFWLAQTLFSFKRIFWTRWSLLSHSAVDKIHRKCFSVVQQSKVLPCNILGQLSLKHDSNQHCHSSINGGLGEMQNQKRYEYEKIFTFDKRTH